jgi:hypothetical protein
MNRRSAWTRTLLCALVLSLANASAFAQAVVEPPAQAPVSEAPAAVTPASAPATTDSTPADTAAAPATAVAAPAAPAPAAPAPAPTASTDPAATRDAERARLRLLLARARAERAALQQQQGSTYEATVAPQPEPKAVHGDAGAALAVALSVELPFHSDDGFGLVSEEEVAPRIGVWASYDLLALGSDAFIAAGLGFEMESAENDNVFGGQLQSSLTAYVPYATAVLRYVPIDLLQPHVRLSAGAQLTNVELQIGSSVYESTDFSDQDVLPFGSLGAGITLRSPTRLFETRRGRFSSLSLGLMLEAGYALVAPLGVTLDGEGPAKGDITLVESELGEITRSGPFFRTSIVARF